MRNRICFLALAVCLALCAPTARAAFSDVLPGSWYEASVTQMAEAGLLSGYPNGSFRPEAPISAAEFITITARQAGLSPARGQTSHWAADVLQAALDAGWYDWDELPPTGEGFDLPISRQLAVKILMRALLPGARGDYSTEAAKIADLSALDGRYYEAVFAAYASGVAAGDAAGTFRPKDSLSRAEACALIQRAIQKAAGQTPVLPQTPVPAPVVFTAGGVSQNGWLQVVGAQLCSERGEPILLRGMSSHGLQWFPAFAGAQAIQNVAAYGANVFRVAMYTGEGGYLSQPEAIRQQVYAAIDAAIANDLYVIADWHILSDGNPMTHLPEAEVFFSALAERYGDCPNLIYEICNEPNGDVSWTRDIKPYAQRMVEVIRAGAPRSVILIGSSTWSQDIHLAAADPVAGENLMYTLHFYAGTHGEALQQRLDQALAQGLPVFVSEWGTSRADGSGGVFLTESAQWLDFLEARGVSWCNWSLCDKDETSAALRPGTPAGRAWTEADLSASGQFVFARLGAERGSFKAPQYHLGKIRR